ncbi:MAG: DUF3179 domain-containing protein [Gemmatimonadetes bacterium]|nr:DUF3179 domain-containing protein [Gemmatimonadota bacterium]
MPPTSHRASHFRASPPASLRRALRLGVFLALASGACGDGEPVGVDGGDRTRDLICDLNRDLLVSETSPGAIPAMTQPPMVTQGETGALYLEDDERVLGVVANGSARAYPHAVLDHHEVINDRVDGAWFTVTFCPLTGSGLRLDPQLGAERLDVAVSGLLFANNLVLYDRTSGDVYGPQLAVAGTCSRFRDQSMTLLPVVEMSWGEWKALYPTTLVVSSATGFNRNYRQSPYEEYRQDEDLLHDMPVDRSRPLKERVLGIRSGDGSGIGFPFGELASALGSEGALNEEIDGEPTTVFYQADDGETAIAFYATVGGQPLTFAANNDGTFTDAETGSVWRIDGLAVDGQLAGERLDVREDAFVVYWFAWRHFQPDAEVWAG